MARKKRSNSRTNTKTVKKNTVAQVDRNIARRVGRLKAQRQAKVWGVTDNTFVIEPFRAQVPIANRTPPEQGIAKRKKPITKWSDKNLRLRCKDRPKDNKPSGASGGKKEFVPWC
jgi:hypothetical protein